MRGEPQRSELSLLCSSTFAKERAKGGGWQSDHADSWHAHERQLFGAVAGDVVVGPQLAQRRRLDLAALDGVLAARMKVAARGRIGRIRHLATQRDALRRAGLSPAQMRIGL